MEFLNGSLGIQTVWAVRDENISREDDVLIKNAQET